MHMNEGKDSHIIIKRNVCQKIRLKPLKEINLGNWLQLYLKAIFFHEKMMTLVIFFY